MSLKRDNATLPELTEENEDERTPSTLHKPEQDSVRFKVHIVLNPVAGRHSTADVTVSGALTPTSQEVSSDVHPTPLQGPSRVCKQSRNHRASTPSLKASGSKSPRGVRRVDVASTPVQRAGQHQTVNGSVTRGEPCDGHAAESSVEQVRAFLRSHTDFLERFVMEEVELETLERWMIRSTQRAKKRPDTSATGKNGRKTSLSRWKFCVHADKRQMLQELTRSLQQRPNKAHVLWELAGCICSAVGAEGYQLYLAENGDPEMLGLYLGQDGRLENGQTVMERMGSDLTVPVYVAKTREPLRLSRGELDPRFPDRLPNKNGAAHALYQPVIQTDGQLAAVVELWRGDPFHEEDEEIASSYLVWGGIALHYAQLYLSMNKQRKLNDFLLAVVKSIFQDMVSMDTLIMKIMNFAQRLVDADRASLFLVDSRNKELYARIFDIGITSEEAADSKTGGGVSGSEESIAKLQNSTEIRFPVGTGIAGQVAKTGEVLNITDAYCDSRFNRTIDKLTGYRTKTILCMPIFIRGNVIGVVQMVNKHCGCFTKEDEDAFEMFAVYCGLALHHAKLYDKIARSEQKYRVALEVLSYHNTCSDTEVTRAQEQKIPNSIPGIEDYYFSVFKLDDFEKAKHAIYMFKDLFGLSRFDSDSLIRFTLTVRKNYRRVPYHNWTHGFSVANSMYSVIKHTQNTFKANECLALYIASLCHDLDHRGKNNKFMLDTESPLAAIYSTSTMEHHHFNQTVTILQQKGHNIFSKLSSWEYKQVLGYVKHCILATDLALFFPNKAKLSQLIAEQTFSWGDSEHRLLIQAVAMTACDLSASAKPWNVQVKTVKVIFEEFYEQVGFLTGICLPCYTLLCKLIPETKPLLDQCQANLERWRQIDEEIKKQKEEKTGVDALSFLDNVLETSEKTDMEDKISSGSLLEGEKEGQGTSEKNCIQEPSHQHSELTHSMDQSP
ncbi:probable 3',5'-cyclic phosphodiesterase pde-5 isoform X3 [Zootermopsis nevadensis]|uniref:probable 3',5'-cyclic phosphodiesterase pde-5 isoform X3 n=1 Tax=Zootermopsis nevadensis TaxID=136037 RepID=UPI000B8EADD1|nr:probable 3',5'-cyclic phosphodiesterase pde-5 isoform X3 [Zootermopsis nevadensis]